MWNRRIVEQKLKLQIIKVNSTITKLNQFQFFLDTNSKNVGLNSCSSIHLQKKTGAQLLMAMPPRDSSIPHFVPLLMIAMFLSHLGRDPKKTSLRPPSMFVIHQTAPESQNRKTMLKIPSFTNWQTKIIIISVSQFFLSSSPYLAEIMDTIICDPL